MDLLAPPDFEQNCNYRPLSGYHFRIAVIDLNGNPVWFGGFQSLTLSVRNATETYLPVGERMPMYLDGEIQIAWVLEKGLVDGSFLEKAFGLTNSKLKRCDCIPESTRFIISFKTSCPPKFEGNSREFLNLDKNYFQTDNSLNLDRDFEMRLLYCKVDNMSLGIMPGRRVVAERWEGVSEGIEKV